MVAHVSVGPILPAHDSSASTRSFTIVRHLVCISAGKVPRARQIGLSFLLSCVHMLACLYAAVRGQNVMMDNMAPQPLSQQAN
jgi:hypothetical protein